MYLGVAHVLACGGGEQADVDAASKAADDNDEVVAGPEESNGPSDTAADGAMPSDGDISDPTTSDDTDADDPTTDLPTPSDSESSNPLPDEELATAEGCAGVFNPDQVLTYELEIDEADWAELLADSTYETYFDAQLSCGDDGPITIGVRRKRSGGLSKVGLKFDINRSVSGQKYYGLKKLSWENGVASGDNTDSGSVQGLLSEYLSWRLMQRITPISSRVAFTQLKVNGADAGTFLNIEAVDKRFLKQRLGDDSGWLYKRSGGSGDGQKTHEADGLPNPYEDALCYFSKTGCAIPSASELSATLPELLDIEQLVNFGAMNAALSNSDGPLFKDNNYYYYDWEQGRTYIPWDLDTTMGRSFDVYAPKVGGGGADMYFAQIVFAAWRGEYETALQAIIDEYASADVIEQELARAIDVAGGALDGDSLLSGDTVGAAQSLQEWWQQRRTELAEQLP